jgi:hypothetical protein
MPSPGLSEIVTTTLRNRAPKLADNVSQNTALLKRLQQRGKVKPVSGGRTIVQPLEYAENSTFMYYAGYDMLNIQPSDVITAAEFNYSQAAVAVSISGLEQLQNAGESEIIDLLEARIANAERTMVNNLSVGVYSDGTGSGGKQIGGLQLLFPDNPLVGTVGTINRATWPFWRPNVFDATTDGGGAATSANIQDYMIRTWQPVVRNTDQPDLIVADNNYYRLYWESLLPVQRIMSVSEGQAGYAALKFQGADVLMDGGLGGDAPTNHMWMLNTNYIFWRPHSERNMVPLDPDRFSVNQDAMVKLTAFAGQMTISNSSLQALLKD